MKVLLVGGLGFIGRRFIREFANKYEIIVYARHDDILKAAELVQNEKLMVEEGSVEDEKTVDVIVKHKPDVVIHLAGLTGIKKCHERPEEAFTANVYGTFNVIKGCIESKSKLIFNSSREVYGETIDKESNEEDQLIPKNVYGITKMLGEIMIRNAGRKDNMDFTILRLTNVYGPEGDQYGAQIMIRNAVENRKVQILGGSQRLNYVYVGDVLDFINIALFEKRTSKEIFNVGSHDTLTIEEFSQEISKVIEEKISFEYLPMRETETINFRPSLGKIHSLGFYPKTSLREGIKKTINWYFENKKML